MSRLHRVSRPPLSLRPPSVESLEGRMLLSVAPATLVKDINTTGGTFSSYPGDFAYLGGAGGRTVFFATEPEHGRELWVTDGTEAGTQRVAPHSFGSIAEPVPYNGALYYLVFSSFGSTELWKTDGTPAGTALIRKISNNNQPRSSAATVMDGVLYFLAPTSA